MSICNLKHIVWVTLPTTPPSSSWNCWQRKRKKDEDFLFRITSPEQKSNDSIRLQESSFIVKSQENKASMKTFIAHSLKMYTNKVNLSLSPMKLNQKRFSGHSYETMPKTLVFVFLETGLPKWISLSCFPLRSKIGPASFSTRVTTFQTFLDNTIMYTR